MKIRSEYALISHCVEKGIDCGYFRAFKHTDEPSEEHIKTTIHEYIMNEICEMFSFDHEEED